MDIKIWIRLQKMILPQCDSSSGWPQALKIMALSHVYAPSSSPSSKLGLLSHLHAAAAHPWPGPSAVAWSMHSAPLTCGGRRTLLFTVFSLHTARMFAFLEK